MGTLFSGIGCAELAASAVGIPTIFQVESDPQSRKVLERHFPEARRYENVETIKPKDLPPVDIICAGPPCQPVSVSGKRRGTKDHRFLWKEMLEIFKCVKPRWIIIENPSGIASLGKPDSKPSVENKKILFLAGYIEELKAAGYKLPETTTGIPIIPSIPACSVGAPHQRQRLWIIAHRATSERGKKEQSQHPGSLYKTNTNAPGQHIYRRGFMDMPPAQFEATFAQTFHHQWWEPESRMDRTTDDGTARPYRIGAIGKALAPPILIAIFYYIKQIETGGIT